jgi:hypothetical protein
MDPPIAVFMEDIPVETDTPTASEELAHQRRPVALEPTLSPL